MLNLNASSHVMDNWAQSIEHYFAMHLSGFTDYLDTINLSIDEQPLKEGSSVLYHCTLDLVSRSGFTLTQIVEREDCVAAIDYSFAKAKRSLQRRMRGLTDTHKL